MPATSHSTPAVPNNTRWVAPVVTVFQMSAAQISGQIGVVDQVFGGS